MKDEKTLKHYFLIFTFFSLPGTKGRLNNKNKESNYKKNISISCQPNSSFQTLVPAQNLKVMASLINYKYKISFQDLRGFVKTIFTQC